jgi:hypothetical protein
LTRASDIEFAVAIVAPQPVAARAAVDNQFVAARFAVD